MALVATAGCSVVQGIRPEGHPLGAAYREALAEWSRKAELRDGLTLALGVVATLRSPDFRKAYVAEDARLYALPQDEQDKLLASELKDAGEAVEVMVSLAGPREDRLRLDKENCPWKLYLEDSRGNRYDSSSIRRITSKDVKNVMLYPYFDDWNHLFSARFAIPPGTSDVYGGSLRLLITGVLGQTEVSWGPGSLEGGAPTR